MSHLIDWLEETSARDTRVRAVLRRSLAFEPGTFAASYPYVEAFASVSLGLWHRSAQYLVCRLLLEKKKSADTAFLTGCHG